ncbi:hypothetical protein DdX_08108 [Ditylenchus destructor]|uniref:Uncharacterized protein n=1 Tax=Ditylenchus destructor TaxID=166010 RepID=A0AAD4N880_9BILA|nr:hypothetical protein DdX_08108 [Ditylenchus destructor]
MHHQPSPYLRRYRLPQLTLSSSPSFNSFAEKAPYYDELLGSPLEEIQAKLDLIHLKNEQIRRKDNPYPVGLASPSTSSLESTSSYSPCSPRNMHRIQHSSRNDHDYDTPPVYDRRHRSNDFNSNLSHMGRISSVPPNRTPDFNRTQSRTTQTEPNLLPNKPIFGQTPSQTKLRKKKSNRSKSSKK